MSTNTKHSKKGIMIAHNTQSTDMHTCIVWSKPFNKFWTNKLLVHKAVYVYCKAHYNTHQTLILQHTHRQITQKKSAVKHTLFPQHKANNTQRLKHTTQTHTYYNTPKTHILQHTTDTHTTTHNRYTYYYTHSNTYYNTQGLEVILADQ